MILYVHSAQRLRGCRLPYSMVNMKIYLVKRSFFNFRGIQSYDLDLLGKSCLVRMREALGAEVVSGALPAGEKLVLYPVYPFLTAEEVTRFLSVHTGSVRFRGGYLERGGSFREGSDPADGMFALADYPRMLAAAERESAAYHAARGALVEEGARVDLTVQLGRGVRIGRGTCITGNSTVGEDAEIVGESFVQDSVIGAGTRVESSVLHHARVGKRCTVGPFARLRPASAVVDDCRIGDFVELKNARIGDGCKISHLAYVGDADLGERVNVGCGAVFVNYNGKRKSRTRVGIGAFIGSNCNLVAPVQVGDGAYLAAGTTLTRDLAAHDFCIGRSRETIKKDRAERYLK